ncbi:hypothetical protein [Roseococcus thiosulfatophilus]|uniref:hypothetical protein n=1 Tax=Roseococcus thiosulfatophilus TaxID=35813 RepID=UPI001A8CEC36|nr:hypothetical protein [Roseococcus thiosulfatophilus]
MMEKLPAGRLAAWLRASGQGAVLLSAGREIGLAGAAARDLARAGRDVLLLHAPADEAIALSVALDVEAEGRRCELVAGALDDMETCEEAALHAAFLGRGRIAAVVCVEGAAPDTRGDVAGFATVLRAAVPLLAPDARVVHLQPELPREAGLEALSARRLLHRSTRRLLGRLRREHGLHGLCMTAAAGWAWAAENGRAGLDARAWAPSSGVSA